jgi:hypothetical protein
MAYGTAKTTTGKIKIFAAFQGVETGKYIAALTVFEWKTKQMNWLQLLDNSWVNCGTGFQYSNILTYPSTVAPPPPPPAGKPMILDMIQLTDDNGIIWINTAPVTLAQKPPILVSK